MKVGTFAALAVAGMAATSLIVWTATSPAEGSGKTQRTIAKGASSSTNNSTNNSTDNPTDNPVDNPDKPATDRSAFQAGGTLMMEGRLGHAVLPSSTDSETYLYVDVNADASLRAKTRSPLNLSIVIDRSGSMKGQRLENALDAARTVLGRLTDGDTVSVVAYNKRTEVVVPPTTIDATSRDVVAAKLRKIRAKGDTCISCGITAGMRLLSSNRDLVNRSRRVQVAPSPAPSPANLDTSVNRILLLSDGEATAGVRDELGFRRIAEQCRRMAVSVTTIGVDIDYNERIMAALARDSNGRHFFVANAAGLPAVFDQEMESLDRTVATNTELIVDLAPGIFVDHVFDRTFVQRGNQVSVPLGAFAAADKKSLLMRLRVPRGPAGERPVAAVRMSYNDLVDEKAGSCEGELVAQVSSNPGDVAPLDGLVSARVTKSEAAETLEKANALFRSGRGREAQGLISKRRASFRARKGKASTAAPASRRGDVDKSFDDADGVLGNAAGGFEPAAEADEGAAQVRQNQADAFDLAE